MCFKLVWNEAYHAVSAPRKSQVEARVLGQLAHVLAAKRFAVSVV